MEVLIAVAVILFLLALLFPSLYRAREAARRVVCSNHLLHWGRAMNYYRQDHNDFLPTEGTYLQPDKPYTWFNTLPPYLNAPAYREVEGVGKSITDFPELHIWICPSKNMSRVFKSTSGKNQFHYAMNMVLDGVGSPPNGGVETPGFPDWGEEPISARRFAREPNTVFMFDVYPNDSRGMQDDVGTSYHRDYANVLFLDGRVDHFRTLDFVSRDERHDVHPIWFHPHLFWGYRPERR